MSFQTHFSVQHEGVIRIRRPEDWVTRPQSGGCPGWLRVCCTLTNVPQVNRRGGKRREHGNWNPKSGSFYNYCTYEYTTGIPTVLLKTSRSVETSSDSGWVLRGFIRESQKKQQTNKRKIRTPFKFRGTFHSVVFDNSGSPLIDCQSTLFPMSHSQMFLHPRMPSRPTLCPLKPGRCSPRLMTKAEVVKSRRTITFLVNQRTRNQKRYNLYY